MKCSSASAFNLDKCEMLSSRRSGIRQTSDDTDKEIVTESAE